MRENRPYGSEGGGDRSQSVPPTPIRVLPLPGLMGPAMLAAKSD